MKLGRLITLEGVEGAGKSSQMPAIEACLQELGIATVLTREPGGTALAEQIRSILVDGEDMPAMSELLLMFAARCSHVEDKIRPALKAGQWVVCDRFVDASYAYQGAGRGIDMEHLHALEAMTLGGLKPDHVFLFDLPVETGLQRVTQRGESNRFDAAGVEFMQRVRNCYLQRAEAEPARYTRIDASEEFATVSARIAARLKSMCEIS